MIPEAAAARSELDLSQKAEDPLSSSQKEHVSADQLLVITRSSSRAHRDASKIFVTGLSPTTVPQTLGEYCQRFGEVRYATVFIDPETGMSNGTGKVDFDSEETAQHAIADLSKAWIDGCQTSAQPLCEVPTHLWRPKRENDGRSVFVGGLLYDVDEDTLREFFSSVGVVTFARVFLDRETGRSRGCGKVEYESEEQAQRAIQDLDGKDLNGRPVTVERLGEDSGRRPLQPRFKERNSDGRSVFIGGLDPECQDDDVLLKLVGPIGGVTFAKLFLDRETGRSRGCGKVEFETPELAQRAIRELDGHRTEGRYIAVEPLGQDSGRRPPPRPRGPPAIDGRQVFVGGFGPEVDSDMLRAFGEAAGRVTFASAFTDRDTGRPRGFGKVEFETTELAQRAVENLDGRMLGNLRVTVRIMSQEAAPRQVAAASREPPTIDGRQVFVGGLGLDVDGDVLRKACAPVGGVTYAAVFTDRASGAPKGTGKVEFETEELAQAAVDQLNGSLINGQSVSMRIMTSSGARSRSEPAPQRRAPPTIDGRQVFFAGLGSHADADALRGLCDRVGGVTNAAVFLDRETRQPKGVGKAEFETVELAQRAVELLDGADLDGNRVTARIMEADAPAPKLRDRQASAEPGCGVFVGNLVPEVSEDDLKELLSQAGEVRSSRVFVTTVGAAGAAVMGSAEEAQRAISVFNDSFYRGKRIVVRLDSPPGERPQKSTHKPNVDAMVFVGGLHSETTASQLEGHFGQIGEVIYAGVFMDKELGRSRGSGKVEFSSPELAQRAVSELNGTELDGRSIQVKLMEVRPPGERQTREPDRRHVLVTGISPDVESDMLRALCEGRVGTVTYLNIFVNRSTGEPKGAAKVEFETPDLAERAIQLLSGFELRGQALTVRHFGDERPPPPQADGRTIFVGGLGWDVGTDDLQVFAGQVGKVLFASVFIDNKTGKSKGCGKVQYETPELALQAVEELNGRQLLGRDVSARIMEARPKPPQDPHSQ